MRRGSRPPRRRLGIVPLAAVLCAALLWPTAAPAAPAASIAWTMRSS